MKIAYEDLMGYLNLLKYGVSKNDVPFYANYIHSQGGKLLACNDNVHVSLNVSLPFIGSINFFTLDGFIKQFKEGIFDFDTMDEKLVVTCTENSKIKLNIMDMKLPEVILERDSEDILVTENLENQLKLASKFTKSGADLYSYVYFGDGSICGTDTQRVLHSQYETGNFKTLLDRNTCFFLKGGYTLYKSGANLVVSFPNELGFAVFTSSINYIIDNFGIRKILSFVEKHRAKDKLCNVAYLVDAVKKVSPILFRETEHNVLLENRGKRLEVKMESSLYGTATTIIDSSLDRELDLIIDSIQLQHIPQEYNIFVPDIASLSLNYLYVTDDITGTSIIFPHKERS